MGRKDSSLKLLALSSILLSIYLISYITTLVRQLDKSQTNVPELKNTLPISNTIRITSADEKNQKKSPSWRRLSSHTSGGLMEAGCVVHAGFIWVLSGFDCINMRHLLKVYLYDYKSKQWHPGPSLDSTLHHTLSSVFSVGHIGL